MSDEQAIDGSDISADEYDGAGVFATASPIVICPKCQVHNPPDRATCSQCGAKLLAGRDIRERVGYLIAGVVSAAIFVGLAWLFARMEEAEALPQCCTSPAYLLLLAFSCLVGGLAAAFGRTPEYEKYLKRAQRHIEVVPDQALADFARALELAPEKKQAGIRKQRGEFYSKLGRREEALADLSAYTASSHVHGGAKVVSEIVGVDMESLASAPVEKKVEGLREELVHEGALKGVGYCRRCKDAVELDENRRCVRCGHQVKKARFIKPWDSEAEMAKLRREVAVRRKRRLVGLTVGGVILGGCALLVGMGTWLSRMREQPDAATAAVTEGTTSKGTPASAKASASSPPRPKTYGSPPLRRTTLFPCSASRSNSALISS